MSSKGRIREEVKSPYRQMGVSNSRSLIFGASKNSKRSKGCKYHKLSIGDHCKHNLGENNR